MNDHHKLDLYEEENPPPEEDRLVETDTDALDERELAHEPIQHGVDQSISKQERLKHAVEQHPGRDLSRVESIEPPETPDRV